MPSWIELLVLAIVQGLTEFIPISSTAHLRIVPALFGWDDPGSAFTAVLQIGTLVAVLWYFWRDIPRILAAMIGDVKERKFAATQDSQLGWMIVLGTLPIVVCALLFKDHIKGTLRSLYVISAAVAGVAALLAMAEWVIAKRRAAGRDGRDLDRARWRDAFVVGCAQAAALVPGTSRSGATILGGLCTGLTREAAAKFSFLLSIPAILAAGVFEMIEEREALFASSDNVLKLLAALVVTAIVGYATIPWLLGFLRNRTMFIFIVYRFLLAALLLYLLSTGKIAAYDEPSSGSHSRSPGGKGGAVMESEASLPLSSARD